MRCFIVVVLKARLLIAMALYKIPMYIKEMYMIYMRMIFPIIQPRFYPRIHPQDVWNWATDFFSDFFCTSDYKILSNDFAALCHKSRNISYLGVNSGDVTYYLNMACIEVGK